MSSGKPCKYCGHATEIYDVYCVSCGRPLDNKEPDCKCFCRYCQNCEKKEKR